MNDKTIDSILEETRQFPPSKESSTGANITKEELEQLKKQASDDYEGFWAQLAKENLYWFKEFTTVLNEENAPNYEWFGDGEINVSYNCLDKNVESSPNKTAIILSLIHI